MKQPTLILLLCFTTKIMFGQNLVPNSSFEQILSCPSGLDEIYRATPWFQPCLGYSTNVTMGSSSDLFSSCSTSSLYYAHSPDNFCGFQFPRTDSSYAGIILYNPLSVDTREYIQVKLDSSLITNKIYCIEFYVSRANYSEYAVGNIGAYFSSDSLIDSTIYKVIDYVTPQFEYTGPLITDTLNWILISGSFAASGGEKYLTIGNFRNDINTNYGFYGGGLTISYYYIEDVSVTECGNVNIDEFSTPGIKTYPNPAQNGVNIEFSNQNHEKAELILYNSFGQIIRTYGNNTTNCFYLDRNKLPIGFYYFQVRTKATKVGDGKIIFE